MQFNDILGREIVHIYAWRGIKRIHFLGYFYDGEVSVTENPDETFRLVEPCGMDYPLSEYLDGGSDWLNQQYECNKQYIGDLTEDEVIDSFYHFCDNGAPAMCLRLDMDTPDGFYIL